MSEPLEDYALLAWAVCRAGGAWLSFGPGFASDARDGEFVFYGVRYLTTLDDFGVPVVTGALRAAITEARERWQ